MLNPLGFTKQLGESSRNQTPGGTITPCKGLLVGQHWPEVSVKIPTPFGNLTPQPCPAQDPVAGVPSDHQLLVLGIPLCSSAHCSPSWGPLGTGAVAVFIFPASFPATLPHPPPLGPSSVLDTWEACTTHLVGRWMKSTVINKLWKGNLLSFEGTVRVWGEADPRGLWLRVKGRVMATWEAR